MLSSISMSILSSVLAFVVAAPCGAIPTAPGQTVTTSVVVYTLQNHNQHVTVKDGAGKTLKICQSATPTLQLVISLLPTVSASSTAGNSTAGNSAASQFKSKFKLHQVSLMLEDQNGLGLWSRLIPVAPEMHTFNCTAKTTSAVEGTRLELTFSTKEPESAPTSDGSAPPPMVMVIGAEGQFVGLKGLGKVLAAPGGSTVIISPDGGGESASLNLSKDGNGRIAINGTQIPMEQVTRDGKPYMSFPWNGHKVFVGGGCTFTINGDGDLTIDPPSTSN